MKYRLIIAALAICMMLSLAACTNSGNNGQENGGSASSAGTESVSAQNEEPFTPMEVQDDAEIQLQEDESFEVK